VLIHRTIMILALSLSAQACDVIGLGRECDAYAAPALLVTLVDSLTGAPIPTPVGVVIATSGAYADTARLTSQSLPPNHAIYLAEERPGTYTLDVRVAAYRRWLMENIRVGRTSNGCHVETRHLQPRLSPE
jgi:hypothetical protein